jgi:hypothetical protein
VPDPVVKVLAEVPNEDRYSTEAFLTRKLRSRYYLLNVKDGFAHTPESRRRIARGKATARAAQEAA